jgi:hypothetical protein
MNAFLIKNYILLSNFIDNTGVEDSGNPYLAKFFELSGVALMIIFGLIGAGGLIRCATFIWNIIMGAADEFIHNNKKFSKMRKKIPHYVDKIYYYGYN